MSVYTQNIYFFEKQKSYKKWGTRAQETLLIAETSTSILGK